MTKAGPLITHLYTERSGRKHAVREVSRSKSAVTVVDYQDTKGVKPFRVQRSRLKAVPVMRTKYPEFFIRKTAADKVLESPAPKRRKIGKGVGFSVR